MIVTTGFIDRLTYIKVFKRPSCGQPSFYFARFKGTYLFKVSANQQQMKSITRMTTKTIYI